MAKVTEDPENEGQSGVIMLIAWCKLGNEVLLIMERPPVCVDLMDYCTNGKIDEELAKVMTLSILLP